MFHFSRSILAVLVVALTSVQLFTEVLADPVEPLALQKIMQGMGENMQLITKGISSEDWELVEKTAPLIADHPQPPIFEKMKIFAYINTDMGIFKGFDEKTHEAAKILGKTAASKDGHAIIADFATLQDTCLMCHERFRKPFKKYFYDTDE